jgi:predicted RNA-binding Zn-ribbon protein involved in translation (DUF1610 family)
MEDGEFARAAPLFDRLAVEARRQGMPIRSANLALRAAQAYLAQDDVDVALDRILRVIRVLARHGRAERVGRIVTRADDELRGRGYDAQADELAEFAEGVLGETGLSLDNLKTSSAARATEAHGSLPARCVGCGAPLAPDDVTWHDAQTAECPYCGTVIKTT